MAFTEPLNLERIFVNFFAGSMEIFFFIAMAFFAYLAVKFRMPNQVFLILMALFVIMLAGLRYEFLYLLAILLAGLFFYYTLSRIIKS